MADQWQEGLLPQKNTGGDQWQEGTLPTATPATPPQKLTTPSMLDKVKEALTPGPDTLKNTMIGVGAGMYTLGKGAQQLLSEAGSHIPFLPEEMKKEAAQRGEAAKQERLSAISDFEPLRQESTAAKVGQFVGEVAPTMVIPGGITGGALKRAGTAALAGAGIGAVMEPDKPLTGAVKGAAGGAIGSGLISAGGKVVNALTKNVPKTAITDLSEKWHIPTTLAEETKAGPSRTDIMLERAPSFLGSKGFRAQQQDAAHNAAKDFLGRYVADPTATDVETGNRAFASNLFEQVKGLVNEVPNQAIAPTETRTIAQKLLGRYPDIFKKFQDTQTEGLLNDIVKGTEAEGTQKAAPQLFDYENVMKDLGRQTGILKGKSSSGHFTESDFQNYLKQYYPSVAGKPKSEIMDALKDGFNGRQITPFRQSILDDLANDLESKGVKINRGADNNASVTHIQSILNNPQQLNDYAELFRITPQDATTRLQGELAKQTGTAPKSLTFDELWTLRQGLGDKIGMARAAKARGEIDNTAYSQIKELFGAVSNDLDKWAGSIGKPEIAGKFRAANDAYKTFVVKHDVLQRAYDKVTREVGDEKFFSPQKFSNELGKLVAKNKYTKNFTGAEITEMSGLANIMQVVRRAGQFMENPPTANRWGPAALGLGMEGTAYQVAGMTGALKTAGVAAGVAGVTRFLTTTAIGKRLCMAASKYNPEGRAMQKVVDEIYSLIPKAGAVAASGIGGEGMADGGAIPGKVVPGQGDVKATPTEPGEYITPVDAIIAKGHELSQGQEISDMDAYNLGKQWFDQETMRLKQLAGNPTPPNNAGVTI